MAVVIHIDSPLLTVREFAARSGIPEGTIKDKIAKGELPTCDTRLDKDKRGAVYINMIKLAQLADNSEFLHPGMGG